jgi:hypothetical protein
MTSEHLHDVNLRGVRVIRPLHPERRPAAGSARDPNARLDVPVGERVPDRRNVLDPTRGNQAGRKAESLSNAVLRRPYEVDQPPLATGRQCEHSVGRDIRRPVDLEFIRRPEGVAVPPVALHPSCRVQRRELVIQSQSPVAGDRRRSGLRGRVPASDRRHRRHHHHRHHPRRHRQYRVTRTRTASRPTLVRLIADGKRMLPLRT